jgi:hypothetical protein
MSFSLFNKDQGSFAMQFRQLFPTFIPHNTTHKNPYHEDLSLADPPCTYNSPDSPV